MVYCVMRIRLYGKTYIGAYIEWDNSKTVIDKNNCFIVKPMERNAVSYVINDRFRQPKGVFLVKKNGKSGAINVADNKRGTAMCGCRCFPRRISVSGFQSIVPRCL